MKNVKKIIILLCIIISIIVIVLIVLQNKKQNTTDNFVLQDDKETLNKGNGNVEYVVDSKIKKVSDKIKYYAVKSMIDRYFEYMNMLDTEALKQMEDEDIDIIIETLTSLFDNKYIEEFQITKEKILSNDFRKYVGLTYQIENMYMLEKPSNINIFLIDLYIEGTEENTYFIVTTDWMNSAFKIYGDDYVKQYGYDKDMEKLEDFEISNIEKNEFNKINSVKITDQDIAVNYFNDYKNKNLHNIQKSYNLLDEEYRNKRFGNIDEYNEYINENIDMIKDATVEQYLVNEEEDYTEYVCKDQYENLYIFKEKAIMDYTVELDTYTIITDEFEKQYTSGNDNKKVIMNIDKFIQMLNNYDYKAAYGLLNNTFKQNNFKTEEEFKKYIQNTYYRYNNISVDRISDENGTYVCEGTISNKQNSEEEKKINIIMKLNAGTDFEMSFGII